MKKDLSNTEQWSRRIGFVLSLLVLMDCIVPFTWNAYHQKPGTRRRGLSGVQAQDRSSDVFRLVESLGKIISGKNFWFHNEFGLDTGDDMAFGKQLALELGRGSNKVDGIQFPDENRNTYNQDLHVYILPDLRRSAAGDNAGGGVSTPAQELSLADSDAIDFYWRQDIDAEKGLYPNLWSPDLQYERDVQLVTEKTLLQQGYSTSDSNDVIRQTEFLRNLLATSKEYITLGTTGTDATGADNKDGWSSGKAPFVFDQTMTLEQHQPAPENACAGHSSNQALELDWLNSTTAVDPRNDVFLDMQHDVYPVDQTRNEDLATPPVFMEWESKQAGAVDNSNADHANPMLFDAALFANSEFDVLPTPDLQLAPTDAASLFSNRQVLQDLAEAQTTKEMMLFHSPVATADAFASASASTTGVIPFTETGFDGNFGDDYEVSDALMDNFQPYNNPYPTVPAPTWHPTSPNYAAWQSQPASSTIGSNSASPTWSGDHDYITESPAGTISQYPTPEWSFTGSIKSEPKSFSEDGYAVEDYDDDDEEYSKMSESQSGRIASERDELRARQLNLPYTAAEIVLLSQPDYVSLTRTKGRFTKDQLELIKEIRRHGGNKEAARRSRQKKVLISKQLEDEVQELEAQLNLELLQNKRLISQINSEERAIGELKRRQVRKI